MKRTRAGLGGIEMRKVMARVDWALVLEAVGLLLLAVGLTVWFGWARAAVILGGLLLVLGVAADLLGIFDGGNS